MTLFTCTLIYDVIGSIRLRNYLKGRIVIRHPNDFIYRIWIRKNHLDPLHVSSISLSNCRRYNIAVQTQAHCLKTTDKLSGLNKPSFGVVKLDLTAVLFDPLGSEHDAVPGDCRGGSVRGAVVKLDLTAVLFDPLGSEHDALPGDCRGGSVRGAGQLSQDPRDALRVLRQGPSLPGNGSAVDMPLDIWRVWLSENCNAFCNSVLRVEYLCRDQCPRLGWHYLL